MQFLWNVKCLTKYLYDTLTKKTPKRLTPSGFSLETLLQIKTVVSVKNFLNKNFRLAIKGLVQNC